MLKLYAIHSYVLNIAALLPSGQTKSTLLLLQEAVKEGKKCDQEAKRLLTTIETMCRYLQPLNGYASKFEKVVRLLTFAHKNLDKLTKFADNIPRIGQLRKIIVEKVIPMVLDALELVGKEVRRVIDYETIILKYKKTAKLLWRIDKHGNLIFYHDETIMHSISEDPINTISEHSILLHKIKFDFLIFK